MAWRRMPDVLEARSAAAQADYDLQAAVGATEIAHGDLATAIGISPTVHVSSGKYPGHQDAGQRIAETVEALDRQGVGAAA